MSILSDLRTKVQRINDGLQTGEIVRNSIVLHGKDILELQQIQLLQGLTSSGEDIRPYYSEDLKPGGYFYSVQTAQNYADWKKNGINYPYSVSRNPDAPNLYINGKFHDELGVQFLSDSVGVVGTTPYASAIVAKYGINTFGLMPTKWNSLFWDYGLYGEIMEEIKVQLYG